MSSYDTQSMIPPPPPPRPPGRWSRRKIITVSVTGAVVLILVLAGVLGAHMKPKPAAASSSAPAVPSSFSPASTVPAVSAMSSWCAGPGYADLQAVNNDLTTLKSYLQADDLAGAEAFGTTLAADAEAAESLPPPVTQAQKVNYVLAMGALSFAGADLSEGNLTAANRAVAGSGPYFAKDQGVLSC